MSHLPPFAGSYNEDVFPRHPVPEGPLARHALLRTLSLILAPSLLTACGDENPTSPPYEPEIPGAWAPAVTNPLFPLSPGTTYTFRGETEDGIETTAVEVYGDTKTIMGVVATVVRDRVYLDGALVEDTWDWYAQDTDGNVWYLGEDSREIENGEVVGTGGSWEWGVNGALPGIIMWADPGAHVGEEYRQEYYRRKAEDWGKVAATNESVTVPYGSFDGCLKTEEWNALEKDTREAKWYCPQVGFVKEITLQGGNEVVELITVSDQ